MYKSGVMTFQYLACNNDRVIDNHLRAEQTFQPVFWLFNFMPFQALGYVVGEATNVKDDKRSFYY